MAYNHDDRVTARRGTYRGDSGRVVYVKPCGTAYVVLMDCGVEVEFYGDALVCGEVPA